MVHRSSQGCPCGSGAHLAACCGPFLADPGLEPATPEKLMRSRFSAFVQRDAAHLARTLHPAAEDFEAGAASIEATFAKDKRRTVYRRLAVLDASPFNDSVESEAHVLFLAEIKRRGKDVSFVEDSTFVRTAEGWRYLCGVLRTARELRVKGVDPRGLDLESFARL